MGSIIFNIFVKIYQQKNVEEQPHHKKNTYNQYCTVPTYSLITKEY